MKVEVTLPEPHKRQREFIESTAKRIVIKAGRRSGKTTGVSILAVEQFLAWKRILYVAPTTEQTDTFWRQVRYALSDPIARGIVQKSETKRALEIPGRESWIQARTGWDADTLRGTYADVLILDEFQLMHEEAWEAVGAPMMLDTNGTAIFVFTPPSLRMLRYSHARDPRYATKLFRRAQEDTTGRWAAFHFTSHDNPYLSRQALSDIASDMSEITYRQEILAEDIEDNPYALWKREWINQNRVHTAPPLARVAVAVDPAATSAGDEHGIIVVGVDNPASRVPHYYVLADASMQGSPDEAVQSILRLYEDAQADFVVAEANQGGEWISSVINTHNPNVPVRLVYASRNKQVRAEPISALYQQGRVHHVSTHHLLEEELCQWQPGMASPNRLDALVWGITALTYRGSGRGI